MKKFVKNLSNKQPTKDITQDDKKNKLKLSTANKKIVVKVDKNIVFGKKNILHKMTQNFFQIIMTTYLCMLKIKILHSLKA